MNERKKFVRDWLTRRLNMVDLCAAHGVSRKTGYKWLERFHREGEHGLADQSRRPHGQLGIKPERIRPGHPEESGVHERMHRTLKQETAKPPKATLPAQQDAFDRFVAEFNDERPHESLAMKTPSELYTPSRRKLPRELPRVEYGHGFLVRRFDENGALHLKDWPVFVSRALAAERVGLRDTGNGIFEVYFTECSSWEKSIY